MSDIISLTSLIQNSHRTLFILCGSPYTGKSFIVKQLLEHAELKLVSIDNIFHAHGFDWDSNTLPDTNKWERILNESYKLTKQALTNGKNVLYDSTNHTVASRDRLREVAESVDADTKVVYVKSSINNIWRRWEENQKKPTRSIVSRELVQQTIDIFEEPKNWEDVYIINN